MDTARHVLGILLLVMMPPAVIYWFIVHPFVAFWRRLGVRTTFLILFPALIALGYLLYRLREPLLGRDLGTSWWLVGLGVLFYLAAIAIEHFCRRHLSFAILAGVPELSSGESKGVLLREGIYGVVRHPRYVSVLAGMLGWALIINYAGVYLLWVALTLSIVVIIRLEERELMDRFGADYAAYRERVPMLVPRRGGRGAAAEG